ncbi:unnamed protein product [Mycena citricolor]|uniref:Uncharacterized protein n=1 Tax=Mycena citricolor TaxID=2018698 RepID=A0AAD2JWT0_9AGAR|nr:unnamed protein product [Mycena citricolor]
MTVPEKSTPYPGPAVAQQPQAPEYAPMPVPSPPTYAQPTYESVLTPPPMATPQLSAGPNMTAFEIGERYRAELYAQCAQGIHQPSRKYGVCGIISAVLLFPVGLICLLYVKDRFFSSRLHLTDK